MAIAPQRPFKPQGQRATVGQIFAPLVGNGGSGMMQRRTYVPPAPAVVEIAAIPRLSKLDRHLVLWASLGMAHTEIAAKCEKSVGWVQARLASGGVALALKRIEDLARAKVERGEFGVAPIAKSHAESMTRILVNIAKSGKTAPAVKRQAANDVLALAGHQPVKRAEILDVNELINQMSPEELDRFITANEWPERMRDTSLAGLTQRAAIDVTEDADDD